MVGLSPVCGVGVLDGSNLRIRGLYFTYLCILHSDCTKGVEATLDREDAAHLDEMYPLAYVYRDTGVEPAVVRSVHLSPGTSMWGGMTVTVTGAGG